MDILVTGLLAVAVAFLVWHWVFNQRSPRHSSLDNEMKRLVTACRGDKDKARRLVEYERRLNPNIRTINAIQNAFDRLERDRQR